MDTPLARMTQAFETWNSIDTAERARVKQNASSNRNHPIVHSCLITLPPAYDVTVMPSSSARRALSFPPP